MRKMKKRMMAGLSALLLCVSSTGLAEDIRAFDSSLAPVYRLYNPHSGEHFYTASQHEADHIFASGWDLEGSGWYMDSRSEGDPIYRLFNPNSRDAGSHYYTANLEEARTLVELGWKWDNDGKPVLYSGGTYPVYVQYNPNNSGHNYTTDLNEHRVLVRAGWQENDVTFHVASPGSDGGARVRYMPSETDPQKTDESASDVLPAGTWRYAYPDQALPEKDQRAIPHEEPTVLFEGRIDLADMEQNPLYLLCGDNPMHGKTGIQFEAADPFGAKAAMKIIRYTADASMPGDQYTVRFDDGANRDIVDFSIAFYAAQEIVTIHINGKARPFSIVRSIFPRPIPETASLPCRLLTKETATSRCETTAARCLHGAAMA